MKSLCAALAVVVGVALSLLIPTRAAACECMRPPDALNALADSNAVFLGTVTQVREPTPSFRFQKQFPFVIYDTPSYAGVTITLAVAQVWRGPAYRVITLTTGRYSSVCGFPFLAGREYLVYGYYNGVGELMTHRCSRTALSKDAQTDIALFGRGNPVLVDAPATNQPMFLALSCTIGLFLTLGTGLFFLRRMR